jgi:hypothetical protein
LSEDRKHETDETWIAKYRAALQDVPEKKSKFSRLRNLAQTLSKKILGAVRVSRRSENANPQVSELNANVKKATNTGQTDQSNKRKAG